MTWLLVIGLTWTLLALVAAVVVGYYIRSASSTAAAAAWTDEVDHFLRDQQPRTRGEEMPPGLRSLPPLGGPPAAAA